MEKYITRTGTAYKSIIIHNQTTSKKAKFLKFGLEKPNLATLSDTQALTSVVTEQ